MCALNVLKVIPEIIVKCKRRLSLSFLLHFFKYLILDVMMVTTESLLYLVKVVNCAIVEAIHATERLDNA